LRFLKVIITIPAPHTTAPTTMNITPKIPKIKGGKAATNH